MTAFLDSRAAVRRASKAASAVVLLFASQSAFAEFGGALNVGQADFKIANSKKTSTTYGLAFNVTAAFGGPTSGPILHAAAGWNMYGGPAVPGFGSFNVDDLNLLGLAGYRFGPFAVIGAVETRWALYSTDGNAADGSYIGYGPGVRFRLGPGGTTLGKVAVQAIYQVGRSELDTFADPSSDVKDEYDIEDLKIRASFAPANTYSFYLEYRNTQYEPAEGSPTATQREFKSLVLGWSFRLL